ncbi:MAG TPA: hypothetical protein VIO64_21295 [Pseudobacteroides sp.]|uniref:hypothetical protein n=1 Tax=Pseudobacteroides sp. TaxID=1968840 RepID=UPI002F93BC81
MSLPNIPNISPEIDLKTKDVINLLLASIALEEIGLSHVINAEAEKIQFVLGLTGANKPTIEQLEAINESVKSVLDSVVDTQELLQAKLENILGIISTTTTTTSTTTTTTTSTTTTTTSTTSTTTTSTTTTRTTSTTTTTSSSTTSTTSTSTTTTCRRIYDEITETFYWA